MALLQRTDSAPRSPFPILAFPPALSFFSWGGVRAWEGMTARPLVSLERSGGGGWYHGFHPQSSERSGWMGELEEWLLPASVSCQSWQDWAGSPVLSTPCCSVGQSIEVGGGADQGATFHLCDLLGHCPPQWLSSLGKGSAGLVSVSSLCREQVCGHMLRSQVPRFLRLPMCVCGHTLVPA